MYASKLRTLVALTSGTRNMASDRLPSGTVTFVFTDIQQSTRLLQQLGDAYAKVLAEHSQIVRDCIQRHDGCVVDTEGDSFFSVFASADKALTATCQIQRSLADHSWPDDAVVTVRIGVHTGEGTLQGDHYVGIDVHRAARIGSVGHGGQIVVSAATHALTRQREEMWFTDLGEHRFKDLDEPERLYQLTVPGLPDTFPALRSHIRPNNLPVQLTAFVGREAEVAAARELLSQSRLVTLYGPGGIGKTRLALQVAAEVVDEFPDGVFFVPLASLSDPNLLAGVIASALGLRDAGSEPIGQMLERHLRGKRLVLVLDNFEHIAAAAPLISGLLGVAPEVKVMVTSRALLHLSGEHAFPVPPMSVPGNGPMRGVEEIRRYESVELLRQRAAAGRPDFAVTPDNAAAIAKICRRLEGLPLAIELAGARMRLLAPEEIVGRLNAQLAFLAGGSADLPTRQQTLRAAIAWSYDLLEEAERSMLRRLGVFRGGWSLSMADAVCNPSGELGIDTLDLMASLLDKSLIRRDERSDAESRFRMLEVIRQFAVEQLEHAVEADQMRQRHAEALLELAEASEPELTGRSQVSYLDALELERDNYREAMRWTVAADHADIGLRMAGALWRFWHLRAHLSEGRGALEEILKTPSARSMPSEQAKGLSAAGSLAYWQQDYEGARSFYEEALELHRRLADKPGIANDLYSLAFVLGIQGDTKRARDLYEESRAAFLEIGDRSGVANANSGLGLVADLEGDDDRALELVRSSVEDLRAAGDRFGEINSISLLGRIKRRMNDPDALNLFREAVWAYDEVRNVSGLVWVLREMAALEIDRGNMQRAVRLAGSSESLSKTLGGGVPLVALNLEDPRGPARRMMSEGDVEKAWQQGAAMSLKEAVAYALGDDEARAANASG
jgi:predicted ATPase/class 3 adenylate cyclase